MSDTPPLDLNTIRAIRARWRATWTYSEDQAGGRVDCAFILQDGRRLFAVDDPLPDEREFLERCASAPGDVQALLHETDVARDRLDDQALTLRGAVESAGRRYQALLSDLGRLQLDVDVWWWIVDDLRQLGCLDCSNNACGRAREALLQNRPTHPNAAQLAELAAARAVVEAARKTRAALPGAADMHERLVALSSTLAAYDEVVKGAT